MTYYTYMAWEDLTKLDVLRSKARRITDVVVDANGFVLLSFRARPAHRELALATAVRDLEIPERYIEATSNGDEIEEIERKRKSAVAHREMLLYVDGLKEGGVAHTRELVEAKAAREAGRMPLKGPDEAVAAEILP